MLKARLICQNLFETLCLIQKQRWGKKQPKKYHLAYFSCVCLLTAHRHWDVTQGIFSIYPSLVIVTEKYFQRF